MKVLNDLLEYNKMKIYQDTDMFAFSLDSVLLANFVTINKNVKNILDIGCGNAVIPLILSTRTSCNIDGVEIQKEVYDLALESIKYNKLEKQITLFNEDINVLYKKIESDSYDVITCNPPFFKLEENSNLNVSEYKKIARHEIKLNLDDLFMVAKKLLKNNGNIAIVHRPERLVEILDKMKKNNIEPKKVQFVYPSIDKEANILLIEGVKNGKPGLKVLEPLYSHLKNGEYTDQIKKYFK